MVDKGKAYDISVIIPTYRDEEYVEECLVKSLSFFRNSSLVGRFEIIFASDRGGDRTIEIIKSHLPGNPELVLAENEKRLQKGGSIRKAMLMTRFPVKMFYDVDLSTPLSEVEHFLDLIEDYDIVIASRLVKGARVQRSVFRTLFAMGFSLMTFLILNLPYRDTQCGFKMFRESALPVFEKQTLITGSFDVEILFLARKMGLSIKEAPVSWHDSEVSNFDNVDRLIIPVFMDTLRVRLNDLKGIYS